MVHKLTSFAQLTAPNACCFEQLSTGIRLQVGTGRRPTLTYLTFKVCKTVERQKGQLGQVHTKLEPDFTPLIFLGLACVLTLEIFGGQFAGTSPVTFCVLFW